jgi:MFS superfamily sulfate permease-like transporter
VLLRRIAELDSRAPGAIVLDAEAVTDIDTTAADELDELAGRLDVQGVRLVFARLAPQAREALDAAGLGSGGADYAHIADAVAAITPQ